MVSMGYTTLGADFYTQDANEFTYSKLDDMRQAWYVDSQ